MYLPIQNLLQYLMHPLNLFDDMFRLSNLCLKQMHSKSLKWIWRRILQCNHTFTVVLTNETSEFWYRFTIWSIYPKEFFVFVWIDTDYMILVHVWYKHGIKSYKYLACYPNSSIKYTVLTSVFEKPSHVYLIQVNVKVLKN